jgi:hypothetical protein
MKKSKKGRQEWELALRPRKFKKLVKIRFGSHVALFQEMLEYVLAINLSYSWQTFKLQICVPSNLAWESD